MSDLVWECGHCHQETSVTHFLQRGGVMIHDPEAAYREQAGLDKPEEQPPGTNGVGE